MSKRTDENTREQQGNRLSEHLSGDQGMIPTELGTNRPSTDKETQIQFTTTICKIRQIESMSFEIRITNNPQNIQILPHA